jgi:hypothetical protein
MTKGFAVPVVLLALDIWHAMGKVLTDDDYNCHLSEVEAVQRDQAATLEALAIRHGLRQVLVERFTEADMPSLPTRLAALREVEKNETELDQYLADVKAMLNKAPVELAKSPKERERRQKLLDLLKEVTATQSEHRRKMLEMGVAFRLLLVGRLDAVLPLDDAALLDAANPVRADGSIKADASAIAKREQAMVSHALKAGPVAVIVCGGSHDLAAQSQRPEIGGTAGERHQSTGPRWP